MTALQRDVLGTFHGSDSEIETFFSQKIGLLSKLCRKHTLGNEKTQSLQNLFKPSKPNLVDLGLVGEA